MAWQQLTVSVSAKDLPQAEALLRLAGAASVALGDDGDTPILEPEPGTTPLWPQLRLRALFDSAVDLGGMGAVLGTLIRGPVDRVVITDEALREAAQQPIRPIEIGPGLAIVAAGDFAGDRDSDNDNDSAENRNRVLGLNMGLAFGTGQHPTTRLCLEHLERQPPRGQSVLDYGCGSGILALAALRLGASRASAIDNEPQALDATRRNAELNQLVAALRIGPPDSLLPGQFDLILANILARPLLELAPFFAARQAPGGRIVLSGILQSQLADIERRYSAWYESPDSRELAGWACLTATRRSEYDR